MSLNDRRSKKKVLRLHFSTNSITGTGRFATPATCLPIQCTHCFPAYDAPDCDW
jgi:hypothetical protein